MILNYHTMTNAKASTMISDGTTFNASTDYIYTKPKVNASGGKSIGILNAKSIKGLYMSTPLMLTWGVNEYTDDSSGRKTYDMSLQFPKEEYNTESVQKFLTNMIAFETKIKEDAISNSKDWMNKAKMSPEVVDALWTPMIKYPKDPNTGESDLTRPPTLRIKFPLWEGEWKCELYDMEQSQLFPNDKGLFPPDLIAKATNVATVIQCGGIWFANGKFGVTWKLVQAVVKPKQTLSGKCFINLSNEDKEVLEKQVVDEDDDDTIGRKHATVEVADSSSDEEDEPAETPKEEVKKVIEEATPALAPKKKVVRKKATA